MYAPKRIDIGWSDLLAGLLACAARRRTTEVAKRVASRWSPAGDAIACLSVRTGLELYLSAVDLPRGSEVLMSAITIPDMVRIVEHHGLVPVPVDVDLHTLGVSVEAVERAVTSATRAIVVAHLFGSRMPLGPVIEVARRHGLLVVEDCAQAWAGPGWTGNAEADVSLFSFGGIKTATALGGALVRVRDPAVRDRMRRAERGLPVQARAEHVRRLGWYAALKLLGGRIPYAAFHRACRVLGIDHDAVVHGAVRAFAGCELRTAIRRRPSVPLLLLLDRRLRRFDALRLAARAARGRALQRHVGGILAAPGRESAVHTHWVFPILAPDPDRVVCALRAAGFDATRRGSLIAVDPPAGRSRAIPSQARHAVAHLVYVPLYPELPTGAVARLARLLYDAGVVHAAPAPSHIRLRSC